MYPQRSVMTCGLATALEPPHFNPRTCEGCDPQLSIRQTMRISFNPCIRVGCDFRTRGEDGTSVPVSIHAPAWGATPSSMALMASATVFQSTHPRGVRPDHLGLPPKIDGFNPRTRVGCDLSRHSFWCLCRICFNPRTRVGCDTSCK